MSKAMPMPLTDEEIAALHSAARRTDALLAASARVLAGPPLEGSPVDQAYKANLHEPFHFAYALMVAAEDYLRTILQMLKTGPLPLYALYTLLRAAAEADVRCRHLLDPGISLRERLARALNERLDNLEEQRKALPAVNRYHYAARVAHLQRRATVNAISVIHTRPRNGKRGSVIGFGEARKTEIELFAKYFPAGSLTFRFLSGYVHSKPWIWLRRDRAEPSASPGVLQARIDLDVVMFANLLTVVVKLHEENVGLWLALTGRGTERPESRTR